jgi:hypothetical protein
MASDHLTTCSLNARKSLQRDMTVGTHVTPMVTLKAATVQLNTTTDLGTNTTNFGSTDHTTKNDFDHSMSDPNRECQDADVSTEKVTAI